MHVAQRTEFELVLAAAYILIAGVNTMPKPGTHKPGEGWAEFYAWLYDWAHVLLNSPLVTRFESKLNITPTPSGNAITETQTTTGAPTTAATK